MNKPNQNQLIAERAQGDHASSNQVSVHDRIRLFRKKLQQGKALLNLSTTVVSSPSRNQGYPSTKIESDSPLRDLSALKSLPVKQRVGQHNEARAMIASQRQVSKKEAKPIVLRLSQVNFTDLSKSGNSQVPARVMPNSGLELGNKKQRIKTNLLGPESPLLQSQASHFQMQQQEQMRGGVAKFGRTRQQPRDVISLPSFHNKLINKRSPLPSLKAKLGTIPSQVNLVTETSSTWGEPEQEPIMSRGRLYPQSPQNLGLEMASPRSPPQDGVIPPYVDRYLSVSQVLSQQQENESLRKANSSLMSPHGGLHLKQLSPASGRSFIDKRRPPKLQPPSTRALPPLYLPQEASSKLLHQSIQFGNQNQNKASKMLGDDLALINSISSVGKLNTTQVSPSQSHSTFRDLVSPHHQRVGNNFFPLQSPLFSPNLRRSFNPSSTAGGAKLGAKMAALNRETQKLACLAEEEEKARLVKAYLQEFGVKLKQSVIAKASPTRLQSLLATRALPVKMDRAAKVIQGWYRSTMRKLLAKKEELVLQESLSVQIPPPRAISQEEKDQAAGLLQKYLRGYLTRREVRKVICSSKIDALHEHFQKIDRIMKNRFQRMVRRAWFNYQQAKIEKQKLRKSIQDSRRRSTMINSLRKIPVKNILGSATPLARKSKAANMDRPQVSNFGRAVEAAERRAHIPSIRERVSSSSGSSSSDASSSG